MHARMTHGCCEVPIDHRHHHAAAECCGPSAAGCCGMVRRYTTRAERREALESYRDQLKNELAGVEERLEELSA